jgi:MFS family permease
VGLPSWYAVAVLFLVSVFNFMDRQLLAILLEPIKRDLGASDTVMGLLTGFAFVLFFALASVPIARAADVRSRRNIIAGALAFWSVMTMLTGLATSFVQLAAARVGLGLGEAATSPAGQSMISFLARGAPRPCRYWPSPRPSGSWRLSCSAGNSTRLLAGA